MICTNFVFWQVWGVRFNIWQKLFKTESQKYPNKEFFLPNLKFLLLHKILHLDIFERVHVKYDNSFSKLHLKDTQLRYFYSQVLRFFVLYKTLHIENLRMLISNMTIIFSSYSLKKDQIWHYQCQICSFLFFKKLSILKILTLVDFKHDSFSKFLPKNTETRLFQWKVKSYKLKVYRTLDELNFLLKNKITN